jgi:hypothetical protein
VFDVLETEGEPLRDFVRVGGKGRQSLRYRRCPPVTLRRGGLASSRRRRERSTDGSGSRPGGTRGLVVQKSVQNSCNFCAKGRRPAGRSQRVAVSST